MSVRRIRLHGAFLGDYNEQRFLPIGCWPRAAVLQSSRTLLSRRVVEDARNRVQRQSWGLPGHVWRTFPSPTESSKSLRRTVLASTRRSLSRQLVGAESACRASTESHSTCLRLVTVLRHRSSCRFVFDGMRTGTESDTSEIVRGRSKKSWRRQAGR